MFQTAFPNLEFFIQKTSNGTLSGLLARRDPARHNKHFQPGRLVGNHWTRDHPPFAALRMAFISIMGAFSTKMIFSFQEDSSIAALNGTQSCHVSFAFVMS